MTENTNCGMTAEQVIQELQNLIALHEKEIREIADYIYTHPELGYKEFEASRLLADYAEKQGFKVERKVAGVETAFRAWFENLPAAETPKICIPVEYDALAGMGHACGHNLISACSIAAAVAASSFAKKYQIPLKLCLMGTPAEESLSGKIKLLQGGAFEGIEMSVMAHPGSHTVTEAGALGVARAMISFYGKAAHAGASPHLGINALDAMVCFYSDMMEWKKTIAPRERVHGIITKGGDAPNIIPDFTEAFFYVRAPESKSLEKLQKRLEGSARIGAEKTGCKYKVDWVSAYQPVKYNRALSVRFKEDWKAAGREIPLLTGCESAGSTDMGDVTQVMPGAHFHFSITGEKDCAGHSIAFREAAGSEEGFRMALETGSVLAKLLLDYAVDAGFRREVRKDFESRS